MKYILTVFLVHALDFPNVHATLDNIVVELIKERSSGNLRTWEFRQRMKVQMVNSSQRQKPKNGRHQGRGVIHHGDTKSNRNS
jgi:hypothetical protein